MALSVSLTFKVSRIIEFAGVVSVSCYAGHVAEI
jgi:hypothetical protein